MAGESCCRNNNNDASDLYHCLFGRSSWNVRTIERDITTIPMSCITCFGTATDPFYSEDKENNNAKANGNGKSNEKSNATGLSTPFSIFRAAALRTALRRLRSRLRLLLSPLQRRRRRRRIQKRGR